ncbi:VanZ family protein [Vibrio sp. Isolate23]|uniref:VanZ family protein n=1 Tax=Vibrio sp. Isolate23 TaxID=2908533 RepID=UPI001EFCBCFD|nr:VanZ family protein [Vibrio sp. Isolate23]MCG9683147.1 VanZ family protein [Vibrio sp. Isolate23]
MNSFYLITLTWMLLIISCVWVEYTKTTKNLITLLLSLIWITALITLTFGTPSGGGSAINFTLLDVTNRADVIDACLNTLLFLPCGMLLRLISMRCFPSIIVSGTLSTLIEVMQFAIGAGRTSDLNDLLFNTLGAILGFSLFCALFRYRKLLASR